MILKEFIQAVLSERKQTQDVSSLLKKLRSFFSEYIPAERLNFLIASKANFVVIKIEILEEQMSSISPEVFDVFKNDLGRVASNYGWHIMMEEKDMWDTSLIYLARDTTEKFTDIPKFVYHVTDTKNVENIIKRGLLPSRPRKIGFEAKRNYEPRVYVCIDKFGASEMITNFRYSFDDTDNWSVLTIDTSKLRPGTKFYHDDEDGTAIWTRTQIPSSAIVDYENL
jgi:hypothetical protein